MCALIPFLRSTVYLKKKCVLQELNEIKADEFLCNWSGIIKITLHK